MDNSGAIDFVVTWVDNTDPIWLEKKAKYTGCTYSAENPEARYRDWDTLKYWFRGVEKFAPWVRYVYFVTDDQKPEWLNLDHPKLKWVKHTDFIPEEYLPTFHSKVINWNSHLLPGISENFVAFDDDVFLIKDTSPQDFFVDNLPCGLPCVNYIYPSSFWSNVAFNNTILLNRHFSLRDSIRGNWKKWFKYQSNVEKLKNAFFGRKSAIPGMEYDHICIPVTKSAFQILWEKEYQSIHETCTHRQRTNNDVSIRCVQCWQFLSGMFHPSKPIGKSFSTASMNDSDEVIQYLRKQKGKVICLNDSEKEDNFEEHKKMIINEFERLLPDKSAFEL